MNNKIESDNLIVNNIYAESIKNNDGIKFINREESINRYFSGETILPYEWAPDYENTFSMYDVSAYTAQASGWISIDRTSSDSTSIFINGYIANTFSNTGSLQLFVSKGDIISASSDFNFTFSPCISDSKISFDFNATPYDIWSGVPVKTDDGMIQLKNLHIPNASVWNIKIREAYNLNITSISDNKAFDGDKFICNIQFEKIETAANLFSYCQNLTSFNGELSSLKDAPGMFFNCNLDAQSVQKILSTIPEYTEGEHNLTLTIQESANETFRQITGVTIELGEFYIIDYKGWKISVFMKDNRIIQTPYDICKNAISLEEDGSISLKNLYIPDASKWNTEIYQRYGLNITSIDTNIAYDNDNFVCNIQSEYIENGSKLFYNCFDLTSFNSSLSTLTNGDSMFLNCESLSDFNSDLSSLSNGTNMFIGCSLNSASIERILNSIPTFVSGEHKLGLTLKSVEEASKFNEITGASVEIGNIYNISYKGWTITTYIAKDDRETPTKYDIWDNVISLNKETSEISVVDLYLPDASNWKSEIYDNFKLRITKVENNKAYNGSNFVCNIRSEKIVNGDNLFSGVASLSSFTDSLSSLSSGVNMFNECSLDSISVETILSTIPTYTDDEHILTMRIKGDAVEKFIELTGIAEVGEEMTSVSFKGWTIQVNKISILTTEYDIWEGTPYIPDASAWRTNVYNEHGLIITDIRDNKIYNGDEFVCNIQCENIENIESMENEMDLFLGGAFSNTHLKNISGNFSSLGMMLNTFVNTDITNFSGDLSSVHAGLFPFAGCYKLTSFESNLSSLICGGADVLSLELLYLFYKIKGFFSNTKLSSFNSDLSHLITGGAMFTNCNKLTSFHSDISSLGNYIKLFEHPMMSGQEQPAPYPPQSQEDIDAWNDWNELQYTSALMFAGCNLDASSVEHILNSLPSYNDGLIRGLGMTISPEAAEKFGEITGLTPTVGYTAAAGMLEGAGAEMIEYKGWIIIVNLYSNDSLIPENDIPEGTEIISEWPLSGAFLNSISTSSLYYMDNRLLGMDSSNIINLANINLESVWYIADYGAFGGVQNFGLDLPSLEVSTGSFIQSKFYTFGSNLGNLTLDMMSFGGCTDLTVFLSNLKSLSFSMMTFYGCSSLENFYSDLRSLNMASEMFAGCSSLSSFEVKLPSLGNYEKAYSDYIRLGTKAGEVSSEIPPLDEFIETFGPAAPDMFRGCHLDAASVENILTSIPEWNDGYYRELGMTIDPEAAAKFGEITGIIPADTEIVEVPFKGWNITVNLG